MSVLRSPLTRTIATVMVMGGSLAVSDGQDRPKKVKGRKISPVLEVLPIGSNLRNFTVPRYDEKLQPTSLLSAELIQVISEEKITADKISYALFDTSGKVKSTIKIERAVFDVPRGVLHAQEKVTLNSNEPRIEASGTGGYFLLDGHASFITGPVEATIYRPPEKPLSFHQHNPSPELPPTTTTMNTFQSILLLGLSPWVATASLAPSQSELRLIAESQNENHPAASTPLSDQEESTLAQAQLPSTSALNNHAENERNERQLFRTKEAELQKNTQRFAEAIGKPQLFLISTKEGASTKKATPETTAEPVAKAAAEEVDPPPRDAPRAPDTVRVTCDGGLFTDTEKGQIVFLKNVKFLDNQATLTCQKDLKIFYTAAKKKEIAEDKKKSVIPGIGKIKIEEIEQIIGTGGVKIILHGKEGTPPTIATADTILYNMKSQTIILKGGFPTIFQKGTMGLQALEPNLTIKIGADFYAKPGKWNTDYTPAPKKK